MRSLANPQAPFERGNGRGGVPLTQGEPAETAVRLPTAERVIGRLGYLERLVPQDAALGKRTQLDQASDQPVPGDYGGQPRLAEVLLKQLAGERRHVPPQDVDGLPIVAQGVVHMA